MSEPVPVCHAITRMIVGGAQLNTLFTCQGLDPRRYRTELVTGPELGVEGDLLSEARAARFSTVVIPHLRREIQPFQDARAYRELRRHLGRRRAGIMHTHTSKAGILARYAGRAAGIPIIIHTAHGWQWTPARHPLMNRFIIAQERRAARFTDCIIVVSEHDREKGLRAGVGTEDRYRLIESAISLDAFDPARVDGSRIRHELGIPPDAPVAGTVGRFAYQKAPEVVLGGARHILETDPRAHFIYVGAGPLRDRALAAAGLTDVPPRLHLVGLRRDIPELLAAMDVFVLGSRYEGLPRVVVEAMALGRPVVSTPADGVVDVVRDDVSGFLVPFEDPAALGRAALRLLQTPAEGRALGSAGRELVRSRFDVRRMVERIDELYRELLRSRGVA